MATELQRIIMIWIGMIFSLLLLVALGVVIVLIAKFLYNFFNTKMHFR